MGPLVERAGRDEARILAHVERLPLLADLIADGRLDKVRAPFEGECAFLDHDLIPHMRAVEAVIYPRLDQIMSCCHSMLGMRREHRELERLVNLLAARCGGLEAGRLDEADLTSVRHALHRLASIARVHLAEESRLIRVLEQNLPAADVEALAHWLDERRAPLD